MKDKEKQQNTPVEARSDLLPSTFCLLPSAFPRVLAATRGLHLTARRLAAGLLPGIHPGRQPGLAREFSQYRAYQPGDDPRHVDWKLFARSDRYFLRESEIETAVTVRVILDATASMRHADTVGSGAGRSKFDLARTLAAALAYLAHGQGDAVGLHAVADGRVVSVQPGQHRQPLERIVHALAALEPAGRWVPDDRALERALGGGATRQRGGGRELAVLLTDLHEDHGEIDAALTRLRNRGAEIVCLHLLGRDELEFPFRGPVRFEDWETGAAIETDAGAARAAYLEGHARHLREWRRAWESERFHYARFTTDEPPERALRAFLLRRLGR